VAKGGGRLARDDRAAGEQRQHRRRHLLPLRDILATAAHAGRHGWRQIAAIAFPVSIVSAGLEIAVSNYVDRSDAVLSFGTTLSTTAISLLGTVLTSGFLCRLVAAAEHEKGRITAVQVARTLPWWRLIVADVLVAIAVVAGVAAFVVPGLVVLTFLAVVGPVVEIEDRRALNAIGRSVRLVRRHFWSVLLLATVPTVLAAELEAVPPEPHGAAEIAEFLIVRGVLEGFIEACIGLVLVELCFRLIDADRDARAAASAAAARS
jgi:hypothetical protein